jgi:small multidrug resistance pump
MSWFYLAIAIVFEIVGTTALKLSDGLARWGLVAAVVACYVTSFSLLGLALRSIEVGVAYAIWSAIGTAAIAVVGIAVFGESVSLLKLASLALIVAGVVGLRMAGNA